MKNLLAAVVVAGAVSTADAVTSINFEVSGDGGNTWASSVNGSVGQTIYVRMRLALHGATRLGLMSIVSQPVLTNWNANDVLGAFTYPGLDISGVPTTETAYEGRHVHSAPVTNTGRLFPFGVSTQTAPSAGGLLASFVDNGNRLRFAGSNCTSENTNRAWGVSTEQLPPSMAGSNFNGSLSVVVFRYQVTLGAGHTSNLVASVVAISGGFVLWYDSADGFSRFLDSNITINPGTIIIPAPGAAGMGGLLVLVGLGRRRRRAWR
jgi:uncharacterized protein (TIGR03382 family)